MTISIRVGESMLSICYKIEPGDGSFYTFFVSIVSTEMTRDVLRQFPGNSVLIVPIVPNGTAYAFISGVRQNAGYVAEKTHLDPYAAALLAYIMPKLSALAPADDILALAVEFVEKVRLGQIVP